MCPGRDQIAPDVSGAEIGHGNAFNVRLPHLSVAHVIQKRRSVILADQRIGPGVHRNPLGLVRRGVGGLDEPVVLGIIPVLVAPELGNEDGEEVTSGIYFYSINAGDFSAMRKMVVAR